MNPIESNREHPEAAPSDTQPFERVEPRDPAENRYNDPVGSGEVPDSEATGLPGRAEEQVSAPPEAPTFSDYISFEGKDPSLEVGMRGIRHEQQGVNDKGFEGTCGLASMSEMVNDQNGGFVSENDLVAIAAENSLCATPDDGVPPEIQGGTTIEGRDQLLREIGGLDVQQIEGSDLLDLWKRVESGEGVLAAVKAGEYSESPEEVAIARAEYGTDHVVWVTGLEVDSSGEVTAFTVNDTGRLDGAALRIGTDQMKRAWEDRGGKLNVARRSIG